MAKSCLFVFGEAARTNMVMKHSLSSFTIGSPSNLIISDWSDAAIAIVFRLEAPFALMAFIPLALEIPTSNDSVTKVVTMSISGEAALIDPF
jgi:hypothetical protein